MNEFGKSLRKYRNRCNDSENLDRSLSQERFGELIGRELGVQGSFSGAAVSDWERGKSRIRADDRLVLTCLLIVLHKQGGIKNIQEANELLAITVLIVLMAWQYRRKGSTVIPFYWWLIFLSFLLLCQIITLFLGS